MGVLSSEGSGSLVHRVGADKTARVTISPSNGRITFVLEKSICIASIRCGAAGRIAGAPYRRQNVSFTPSKHALICTSRHNKL